MKSLVAAVGMVILTAAWSAAQPRRADIRWWHDPAIVARLVLTGEQAAAIDRIFAHDIDGRRARQMRLTRLRAEFDRALAADDADAATALVSRIVALEATQNKERVKMLLQMRQVLDAEQRRLLDQLRPLRLRSREGTR